MKLKPAWPHFGGKTTIMPAVWKRLGDPLNLVDPFAGSGSALWTRPYWDVEQARFTVGRPYRTETVNELNPFIANFYRAVHHDPEQVAHYADWPVSEVDLHARHLWLISQADFRERMLTDPDYYDAKIAGWWCWGACAWIGSGWCSPERTDRHSGIKLDGTPERKRPDMQNNGRGYLTARRQLPEIVKVKGINAVRRQRPQLRPAQGVQAMRPPSRRLPNIGERPRGMGLLGSTTGGVLSFILALSDRLRNVRVTCGDWSRVTGKSVTYAIGLTAVILDPPYNSDAERAAGLYAYDDLEVSTAVRQYALENGDNPKMRIALCGYEGEGHEILEDHGWDVISWQTGGGYSNQNKNGNDNSKKERIWFSPHCLKPEETPQQLALLDHEYVV